jgi:hypothetical protein
MEESPRLGRNLFIKFILANQLNIFLSIISSNCNITSARDEVDRSSNSEFYHQYPIALEKWPISLIKENVPCSVIVKLRDKSSGFGYDLRTTISSSCNLEDDLLVRPSYKPLSNEARSSRYEDLPNHLATTRQPHLSSKDGHTEEPRKRHIHQDAIVQRFPKYSSKLPSVRPIAYCRVDGDLQIQTSSIDGLLSASSIHRKI